MTNCNAHYFHKGKHVVATHRINSNTTLVRVVEDFKEPTYQHADFCVKDNELEPLCFNLFELGDHVYNSKGSFHGTVVAFELTTNRIICISDLIAKYENDRTRYAYTVGELRKFSEKIIEIKPGEFYNINNGKVIVFAMQPYQDEELVTLVDKNGIVFAEDVPFKITGADAAMNYFIDTIVIKKRKTF